MSNMIHSQQLKSKQEICILRKEGVHHALRHAFAPSLRLFIGEMKCV